MKFEKWAPLLVREALDRWEKSPLHSTQPEYAQTMQDIWRNLASKEEMKNEWLWIIQTAPDPRDGDPSFVDAIDIGMMDFFSLPHLSEPVYSEEMREIAELSEKLASKLEKFNSYLPFRNPFSPNMLFTEEYRDRFPLLINGDVESDQRLEFLLGIGLPTAYDQARRIADRATEEASKPFSRLELSRKAKDESAFRSYFITRVANFFAIVHMQYSPTRLATICRLALNDSAIDPRMVNRLTRHLVGLFPR